MVPATVLAFALGALVLAGPAFAVLEEEERDAPPPPSPTTSRCEDGRVWDDVTSTCVDPESGALDDDRLLVAARELAYAGRHGDALRVVAAVRDQTSPLALTVAGFALRKSGRVDEGLALYAAALARDPDFLLARAYRGVYLVEAGDVAGAEAELAQIEARGGGGGWPHRALLRALAGADPY
jgi:tetratricopeptide (TPR) repeat protein